MRLCDSFSPSDGEFASGVRSSDDAMPCAYSPWPASWRTDQRRQDPLRELALRFDREVAVQERCVNLRRGRDELGERRPENVEDGLDLRRRHTRLVVV